MTAFSSGVRRSARLVGTAPLMNRLTSEKGRTPRSALNLRCLLNMTIGFRCPASPMPPESEQVAHALRTVAAPAHPADESTSEAGAPVRRFQSPNGLTTGAAGHAKPCPGGVHSNYRRGSLL